MAQDNVQTVLAAIAALNERDVDAYLACCARDVQLLTPLAAIEGSYDGHAAIRRFFDDMSDAAREFQLVVERIEALDASRVFALMIVSYSGRSSGIGADTPTANIYDLAAGEITRIRVYPDRQQALVAAGLSE